MVRFLLPIQSLTKSCDTILKVLKPTALLLAVRAQSRMQSKAPPVSSLLTRRELSRRFTAWGMMALFRRGFNYHTKSVTKDSVASQSMIKAKLLLKCTGVPPLQIFPATVKRVKLSWASVIRLKHLTWKVDLLI